VRVTAAEPVGEIGEAGELPMIEDAVRNLQPAHERVLRRRHVEQPVVAPAKVVLGFRKLAFAGLAAQARVGVEGVLGAFPLLLLVELAAGRDGLVLRLEVARVGAGRLRWDRARPRESAGRASDRDADGEPFEVAFLLGRKIRHSCCLTPQAAPQRRGRT
jgi:hypothetical protein